MSVKFGLMRGPDGAVVGNDRARPRSGTSSRTHCGGSTPTTSTSTGPVASSELPIEDTIGALAELVEAGYVR